LRKREKGTVLCGRCDLVPGEGLGEAVQMGRGQDQEKIDGELRCRSASFQKKRAT